LPPVDWANIKPDDVIPVQPYSYEKGEMAKKALTTLSELLALVPEDKEEWQDISTAPKDGTMILVCLPRMMNLIVRSRFNTIHKYWVNDYEGEGGLTQVSFYHEGDLWQPLPTLPKQEQS